MFVFKRLGKISAIYLIKMVTTIPVTGNEIACIFKKNFFKGRCKIMYIVQAQTD